MLDTFRKATPDALQAIQEEMRIRNTSEVFLLFANGSQTDHLIFQKVSKLGVFCLVADPASATANDVRTLKPKGIILSGGPASVATEPPPFDDYIFDLQIPLLGICLGFQMWAKYWNSPVTPGSHKEFGVHHIKVVGTCPLFDGIDHQGTLSVLQSHGDQIQKGGFMKISALSDTERGEKIIVAGSYGHLYGVQFHPEVSDTEHGEKIFENFCFKICGAKDRFTGEDIGNKKIGELRRTIGTQKVVLALSGGADSSTVSYLLKHATSGKQQLCGVYIRGIDRPDDEAFVRRHFENRDWITLKVVDATDEFLDALKGKITMHEKRVAIRPVYKSVLERVCTEFGAAFVAQGTLYTDISESGGGHASGARKAKIKLHHNTNLEFTRPELMPLADCVKDGGRDIGRHVGVPEELLVRHPFPGPGLVVRIEEEITREKLATARHVDGVYIEELRRANLYDTVWQAGAVVTQSVHTTSKGDDAGSGIVIALWAVWSVNGFTAQSAELPFDFQKRVSRRIGNEVPGVGAVVYRISDKPFSTIEWG